MLKRKLLNNRGELTGSLVSLLIITTAFALVLSALPIFTTIYTLRAYADEITRIVEVSGCISQSNSLLLQTEIDFFPNGNGPSVVISSDEGVLPGTDLIQLGTGFSVKVSATYLMKVGTLVSIQIPITVRSTGRSEVYFKEAP